MCEEEEEEGAKSGKMFALKTERRFFNVLHAKSAVKVVKRCDTLTGRQEGRFNFKNRLSLVNHHNEHWGEDKSWSVNKA